MARARIWAMWALWLWVPDLGDMTLDQGNDTALGHGQPLCEILSDQTRRGLKVMAIWLKKKIKATYLMLTKSNPDFPL